MYAQKKYMILFKRPDNPNGYEHLDFTEHELELVRIVQNIFIQNGFLIQLVRKTSLSEPVEIK